MTVRILHGDCRSVLPTMPTASVNCIVTSPPYFGLRDYGTARWEGGDAECDHVKSASRASPSSTLKNDGRVNFGPNNYERQVTEPYRSICGKCGARRIDQQIGLEQTPDAYVAELVAVFREARRVLRDDGVAFVNLGDSYSSDRPGGAQGKTGQRVSRAFTASGLGARSRSADGLKPKDLIGIPWRVAFALQADGWWLRQDIIWHKPNPMPESVTDRCTKAHEYVFLLSKSARYWYDAEAISEAAIHSGRIVEYDGTQKNCATLDNPKMRTRITADRVVGDNRNRRSVWTIATEPSSLAHFAMMPTALAELCIKAGCPKGGTVLDPFGGAGTTGLVADRLGRSAILIELNPSNTETTRSRIEGDAGMFAMVAAE